ncbi:MAG: SRPBCC family protein [Aeromicrobium sp.]|uniref:type II toxin-antitoxin system Rv0910 family toxin n=1 Tax=Aeromicrobium sp. TaxID=1871063 RepID=UPI0039E3C1E7
MANVSVTQDLSVSPQAAWDQLTNLESWENWLTIHQGWKSELPSEITVGAQITEVVSVMGMANKIEWKVTEVDAPRSVAIEGAGMAGVQVKFALSIAETDGGSSITMDAEFTGTMIVGPIGKAVAKNTQKDLEASLAKFSDLVAA